MTENSQPIKDVVEVQYVSIVDNELSNRSPITLSAFVEELWRQKWPVLGIGTFCCVLAVVIALLLPNIYRAEALLAPAESGQQGALGGLSGQLGGFASLAGIDLGGDAVDNTDLAIKTLTSRAFFKTFIAKHDVLLPLMATESWDPINGKLRIDPTIYSESAQQWVREVDLPRTPEPSYQEAHKEFLKLITIQQDKETGMVSITADHQSPVVAKNWVDWLIEDVNQALKAQDMVEAQRSITYLEQQLQETEIVELRTVFFQLIEEQTTKLMLANVREDYVFKVVDPAIVPELKNSPKRALIAILGAVLGGFLALVWVISRLMLTQQRR